MLVAGCLWSVVKKGIAAFYNRQEKTDPLRGVNQDCWSFGIYVAIWLVCRHVKCRRAGLRLGESIGVVERWA
jgi:hypothetical protein